MIGLISFHCQYNYGSALQAWAMQTTLGQLGYESKILNFYYEKDMKSYGIRWYSRRPSVIALDLLTSPAMRKRKQAFHIFQRVFFRQTEQTKAWTELTRLSQDCSALICGSDQIWNYALTQGLHLAYFLDFARPDQRKVAYAPSINQNFIDPHIQTQLLKKLRTFDAVSVREQDTAQQLSSGMGYSIPVVLDPTLLLQAEDYDPLIDSCPVQFPEHYIFIYCLHLNHLPFQRQYAERYAETHNAKIVYCNKYNLRNPLYQVNIFQHGPEAFVKGIKHAAYVLADSFHAAALSVLFQKPFSIYAPDGCPSRMNTLFSSLGTGSRFIADICRELPEIPYKTAAQNLHCLRKASFAYLKNAFE